jgi:hypothetical protein
VFDDHDPEYLGFIDQLRSHHRVAFVMSDSGRAFAQASFTLAGASEAISPVFLLCGQ